MDTKKCLGRVALYGTCAWIGAMGGAFLGGFGAHVIGDVNTALQEKYAKEGDSEKSWEYFSRARSFYDSSDRLANAIPEIAKFPFKLVGDGVVELVDLVDGV